MADKNVATGDNQPPIFGVAEISTAVKRLLEGNLAAVRVRGEVSGCSRRGNRYFLHLKEGDAVLRAVVWNASSLNFALEDGQEIIADGRMSSWQGASYYQLAISSVEPAGEGAWLKLLAERKKKLHAEGLFDPARKKPLPKFPKVMALVTSDKGAAVEDILRQVRLNWPVMRVRLWAVAVQGESAPQDIIRALASAGQEGADLLVLARGGGSLEDLMAFNEEAVVRAVAACPLPTVSAIGHQTDEVLTDLAADKSVATPTAVAEVLPDHREWLETLENRATAAHRAVAGRHRSLTEQLQRLARNLPHPRVVLRQKERLLESMAAPLAANLKARLADWRNRLEARSAALGQSTTALLDKKRQKVEGLAALLEGVSHHKTLARGYAIVESPEGKILTDLARARGRQHLNIRFKDGRLKVREEK